MRLYPPFYAAVFGGVFSLDPSAMSWRAILPIFVILPVNVLPFCVATLSGMDRRVRESSAFTSAARFSFLCLFVALNVFTAAASVTVVGSLSGMDVGGLPTVFGAASVLSSVITIVAAYLIGSSGRLGEHPR